MSNTELAKELHKPIIKKVIKKSIITFYRQYRRANLADMQLIEKINKGISFL